ncbi:MAG: protein rep [Azonexus sp.]
MLPPSAPAVTLEQGVVTSHRLETILRQRQAAKNARDREQRKLIEDDTIWHEQILQKLKTEDRTDPVTGEWHAPTAQLANFAKCGHDHVYRRCIGCDNTQVHFYHCMVKWCPLCNWRITDRRRTLLKQWMPTISQPKHIVTTQRNTSTLTREMIREHTRNLAKLRRCEVFEHVRGGCVSVEITNERRGWHIHAHWLVNARWVDAPELARTWGRLVGQDFAIVKVMDARTRARALSNRSAEGRDGNGGDYQRELMKYVVKGSDLARWNTEELYDFITAVRGQRFFFCFGELFKEARRLRAIAECNRPPQEPCDCGCSQYIITTDESNRRRKKRRG